MPFINLKTILFLYIFFTLFINDQPDYDDNIENGISINTINNNNNNNHNNNNGSKLKSFFRSKSKDSERKKHGMVSDDDRLTFIIISPKNNWNNFLFSFENIFHKQ